MSDSDKKRNLPSWMSARKDLEISSSASDSSANIDFSNLMRGVVFVLSGFVNPERGMLRSQALEMGAEYQPDWNSGCTLLVCAFLNTPKFRQVEADSGTIVNKEWISECYRQRKLVDIEPYLMHAGKPWRRQNVSEHANKDQQPSSSRKSQKLVEKRSHSKPSASASSKVVASNNVSNSFSPSRVKQWATDDFMRTLSWLENQDEKPEKSEMKKIAAEGILTCLQDTIDTLNQGQSIQQITEQWACIPCVVEELIKLDANQDDLASVSKEVLCRHAMDCRKIYELQYSKMEDDSSAKEKLKTSGRGKGSNEEKVVSKDEPQYDSDETIEMTEEEIDKAFDTITSTLVAG